VHRDGETDPFLVPLAETDAAVARVLAHESRRLAQRLDLGASENYVSRAQLEASASVVGSVTVEGYPGQRHLGTSPHIDALEQLAIERACRVFGARHANVQPHSGTQANQAVFMAVLDPGDCLLSMRLSDGGHFSHGDPATLSGRTYKAVHYGVRADDGWIEYDELEAQARRHRPRLVVAGGSAYPRSIDFGRLAAIAHGVGALLMADIAHVAGLVAAGLFPNPLPHADVVTTTTYKNLRGVRGGLILTIDPALGRRIDAALCPALQGTPILGLIAGKAVALGEALAPGFVDYQRSVLANARALADALAAQDIVVSTGGTDTPFVVVDLRPLGLRGREAVDLLDDCGIGANAVPLPGDTGFEHASGLRLGLSAATTRGFDIRDCDEIAAWVAAGLLRARDLQERHAIARQVQARMARSRFYADPIAPIRPDSAGPVPYCVKPRR
jgi:glycine hydroxymethyltransferase